MKSKHLILCLFLVLTLSCNNNPKKDTPTADISNNQTNHLKGTWELIGFYNYKDNKVVDSFKTNPEFRQLKMYTDTKVMWCKHRAADSSEWFGYGTYDYDGNQLTEVLDFGSEIMDKVIAEKKQFRFDLELDSNRFKQIELDEDGNRIYSENYKRVE